MYVKITEKEFDDYLKASNGWVKNRCGYEYVYDYQMKKVPSIIVKVMSSINTGTGEGRNKGSDAIRVFAVKIDNRGKVVCGYIKRQTVYRTTNWRKNLLNAYKIVMSQVLVRAKRDNLI